MSGVVNLLVFGVLTWVYWTRDPFAAGMFFTLATYPLVSWGIDALLERYDQKGLRRRLLRWMFLIRGGGSGKGG